MKRTKKRRATTSDTLVIDTTVPPRRDYVPPVCTACLRFNVERLNYSEVTHTVRDGEIIVRYCRCRRCGNTFKDVATR